MKYGEIVHFSHPQHRLRLENLDVPFRCDGCREVGIGARFRCPHPGCEHDLHRQCAVPASSPASSSPLRHPFYPKCVFHFLPRTPGTAARYCNACGRDVAGFVYHCFACGFDLHPCCAALPHVLDAAAVRLYLYPKAAAACHRCGRKGRSWSYRSACKSYNLHVACVMEILVESWHELYGRNGSNGRSAAAAAAGVSSSIYGAVSNGYRVPAIRGVGKNSHRRSGKGKVKRCCELAGLAAQVIISAVLGDPTAAIAGVIGSLISK